MLRLNILFLFILLLISFGASNLETIKVKIFSLMGELNIPIYLFFYLSLSLGVIIANIYLYLKKPKMIKKIKL